MKLAPVPQNFLEWFALKADLVPVSLAHTHICFMLSKAVLEAYSLNVFEAFKDGPLKINDAADKTGLNERALKSLLNVLISTDYFNYSDGKYLLTKSARKWCLKDSSHSLYNQQIFNGVCWPWTDHLREFLKSGKGLQFHETFNEYEWEWYQKGMESVAKSSAKDVVKMAPKLISPTKMLDIGGSHGLYSAEFCKKYPAMKSVILDLPQAVEKAEPLLREHYKGENITYVKGNALTDDFGIEDYDLILISSLMHHFTSEQNNTVTKKIARALKKGGFLIIQEFLRPEPSSKMEMVGTILDLFFNLSSTSGNWSKEELIAFQTHAGLKHVKANKFLTIPGFVQVVGRHI
jgi:ubiquinone/menaquinone biosynthesis C-methylase UbiE